MFKKFTKLNRDELSNLLRFLSEGPEKIFDVIESPTMQAEGWSSSVLGGKYNVKGTPKSTDYDVRINYGRFHSVDGSLPGIEKDFRGFPLSTGENITEKHTWKIKKSIPYQ